MKNEKIQRNERIHSRPFSKNKTMTEFIDKSKQVFYKDNKLIIKVDPSLTKSYMTTNYLYFDTKDWKNKRTQSSKNLHDKKNIGNNFLSSRGMKSNHNIVDRNLLNQLMSLECLDLLHKETELENKKEITKNVKIKPISNKRSLSPNKFSNKIETSQASINKNFGKIPN